MSGKKTGAAPNRRFTQALEVFERAVKALGKRDFEKARDHLDSLIASYPEERDLLERARAYHAVCERALDRRPSFRPRTFAELMNYGVYLHNRGEFSEALRYLSQAAEMQPKNEHALYCQAAAAAQAGDVETALRALRAAIAANPASRAQARNDSDFDRLRDSDAFSSLVRPRAS
jgi:tetratricopeptide (TPR) repeat protein